MEKENSALLKQSVKRRMGQLKAIGVSKYEVRKAYNLSLKNKGYGEKYSPSPYIHGLETFKQYSDICNRYAVWLSENYPQTKKLSFAYKNGFAREYVQKEINEGKSAWSVNRTCCALAKLHGCSMQDIHNNRPSRYIKDIKRGRSYTETSYCEDVNMYGDMAELCRYIGVRRSELKTLTPSCFSFNFDSQMILALNGKLNNTKGGKSRIVEILNCNKNRVISILQKYDFDAVMFPNIPTKFNVHGIRALYAKDFYKAIALDISSLKNKYMLDSKGHLVSCIYKTRKNGARNYSFDRKALIRVSESLGHHRADVIATHYLF